MGLPGKRLSRSSKRRRASHFALVGKSLVRCRKCDRRVLPHRVCPHCGYYKGREVVAAKLPKLAAASQQKKEA